MEAGGKADGGDGGKADGGGADGREWMVSWISAFCVLTCWGEGQKGMNWYAERIDVVKGVLCIYRERISGTMTTIMNGGLCMCFGYSATDLRLRGHPTRSRCPPTGTRSP